jgi:hypothetical protein
MIAFASEATRQRVMDLGGYGFLRKPFNSQVLLTLMVAELLLMEIFELSFHVYSC